MKTKQLINALNNKAIRGQGMTEYIIIVALIAVAAIGVFRFYGNTARSQVAVAASELGGQDSAKARSAATTAGKAAVAEGEKDKKLNDFEKGSK